MNTTTERTVDVNGKKVTFKATALTPRLYRRTFGRDMFQDMQTLREAYTKSMTKEADLTSVDLGIFEDMAFIMAKQADPDVPDTPDEWLDGFEMLSIYTILPELFALWGTTNATTAAPKKK